MKRFLLIYRYDSNALPKGSPEELQAMTKKWMDWIGGIAAQDKLDDRGNRLEFAGNMIRPNQVITDGPYTEVKELIGGYSIVKSDSLGEATVLALNCPIFMYGGNVEVRPINEL
ncbi:MAG TPA: YciI family protein [Chryseolinea sp.]|nr:YciI family protein [Chryseolinea sp.]